MDARIVHAPSLVGVTRLSALVATVLAGSVHNPIALRLHVLVRIAYKSVARIVLAMAVVAIRQRASVAPVCPLTVTSRAAVVQMVTANTPDAPVARALVVIVASQTVFNVSVLDLAIATRLALTMLIAQVVAVINPRHLIARALAAIARKISAQVAFVALRIKARISFIAVKIMELIAIVLVAIVLRSVAQIAIVSMATVTKRSASLIPPDAPVMVVNVSSKGVRIVIVLEVDAAK